MDNGAAGAGIGMTLVYLVIMVVLLVSYWKIFVKAGKPGWAIFVPIYNIIVMLEIIKKPLWWIILFFIPLVNIVIAIIFCIELVKAFGKPAVHAVLLIFFGIIYIPYLAFSDAKYVY